MNVLLKYVNDVLLVMSNLKMGARWDKVTKKILYSEGSQLEDHQEGISRTEVTMRVLKEVANECSYLKFTG